MEKILDMIARWEPIGQGFFLLLTLVLVLGAIVQLVKLGVVLFRGWPPETYQDEVEEA